MKSSIGQLVRKLGFRRFRSGMAIATMVATVSSFSSYGQEYATSQTSSVFEGKVLGVVVAPASVTNGANAIGAPDNTYATMQASGIVVTAVSVSSNSTFNLTLTNPVPANKRAYVKVTQPTVAGITLDLGNLVNLLGLLSNNTIVVTTNAGTASSTFVRDGANNLYIAVSSTSAFSTISLKLDFANSVGLLGVGLGSISMNVDGVVTYENTPLGACESIPYAFSGVNPNATGISLTLTQALQDPNKAVDGIINPTNFSLLQNGSVAAASTVSQTFYLGKTSPANNEVVAVISKPGALLNLAVLDNIIIQAYLGATPVGTPRTVNNLLLTLDLLSLFGSSDLTPIHYAPGGSFDRIVVTSVTILNANLFTGLQIHELGSRPPVSFSGGTVAPGRVGEPITSSLFGATSGGNPSFTIQCGSPSDFTYKLYQVSSPGGRTLAGTLPSSITLNPDGSFSGIPATGQNGNYSFDVQATNQFGQSAITTFTMQVENALPVTLVSFKASAEGQTSLLAWSTSEETNSDRFDIERSHNGKNWTKIGSLASHKESNTERFYSFVDASPLRGDNFYRLKMVDLDETFTYSRIEGLNFKGTALVYPNPVSASENLTLNVGDWSKVKQVKVVNAAGKIVFEASNALLSGINARNLVAGSYTIQVTLTDGTVSSQRFVRL